MRHVVGKMLGIQLTLTPEPRNGKEIRADHAKPKAQSGSEQQFDFNQIDIGEIVQWQFDNHAGFMHSFLDTIRNGPLMGQADLWEKACAVIRGESCPGSKMHNSSVLVFLGDVDSVVVGEEASQDISSLLGAPHVCFKYVPGGHGFPYPNSEEITREVAKFWRL